ncbi:YlxQ family RNA-binding protein [Tepidibacillus infernus]|uniref:50S ribosomal protein L7 n=1 Tax=Tepidibacillus decaturensis TaxID=1413211 RepID=A0A135L318_9BACI|nr:MULTISPECIES: YlxQ family RNA-binding protein [Tepidibacillus]KXG43424.1 50S ribosomal protein L7 [Tepidibacillus decaturensis]
MSNQSRISSMLGLAARAGKVISGEELVIKGIQKGKVTFVILSGDASDNTSKKVKDKCSFYQVPYRVIFNREELGHAIGKSSRVVVGITDYGFSKQLENLVE